MSIDHRRALASLQTFLRAHSATEILQRLSPNHKERAPKVLSGSQISAELLDKRWSGLPHADSARPILLDDATAQHAASYSRNIDSLNSMPRKEQIARRCVSGSVTRSS